MSKYSKMRHANNTKSKSIDFLGLSLPPQMHKKAISNEMKQTSNGAMEENTGANHPSQEHQHEDEDVGEIFGVILSRKCPISSSSFSSSSSTSSCRFMAEKQKGTTFPSMVKKTFSLKRSVSVSEGYSRIHHQHDPYHDDDDDDDDDEYGAVPAMHPRSSKKKGKTMFKACRSLFGF